MTPFRIKGVLFDFDGTLTRPGALDFARIREALGCPQGKPILEYIGSLESARARQAARRRLDAFELQGAVNSVPNHGAQELLAWLKGGGVAVGLLTRNSRASVLRALQNFDQIGIGDFDVLVTRDDPPAPKPSGDGVLWAGRRLRIAPPELLVVGDFIFDVQAGQAAGALTALLDPQGDVRLQNLTCDFRVAGLDQLKTIIHVDL
jgi:hydrogenase expression/formation protein HypE